MHFFSVDKRSSELREQTSVKLYHPKLSCTRTLSPLAPLLCSLLLWTCFSWAVVKEKLPCFLSTHRTLSVTCDHQMCGSFFPHQAILQHQLGVHWVACCRPASPVLVQRPKKEPRVSDRNINGLMDKGILHVWSKVLEWQPTSLRSQGRGWGEGEVTSYRGDWHQVGSLVTRETSRGAQPPTTPLISYHRGDILI